MSKEEESFRVCVRFSKVEYEDLLNDLNRYTGSSKGARIRMLLRLGLAAAGGHHHPADHASESLHLAPVVGIPRQQKKPTTKTAPAAHEMTKPAISAVATPTESSTSNPMLGTADALLGMGIDPSTFQFGATSR